MIKIVNELLKSEGINLEVSKERKDILLYDLIQGFSVELVINDKVYTMELLGEINDTEIIYKGVYLTLDGEFKTTYTA